MTRRQTLPWRSSSEWKMVFVFTLVIVYLLWWTNQSWCKIWIFKLNLALETKVNQHPKQRDFNWSFFCLVSEFGVPSLNGWWLTAWTCSGLTHTDIYTDSHTDGSGSGNGNIQRLKLTSVKNDRKCNYIFLVPRSNARSEELTYLAMSSLHCTLLRTSVRISSSPRWV